MNNGWLDKTDKLLLSILPKDKENPISRKALANKLNLSDRQTRNRISKLRSNYPILADTKNGGYWISNNLQDIADFSNLLYSQGNRLIKNANNLDFIKLEIMESENE